MNLNPELELEITNYCKINDIKDVDAFKLRMLKQGFTIEKYGATPFQSPSQPKQHIKIDEEIVNGNQEPEIEVVNVTIDKIIKKDLYGEG